MVKKASQKASYPSLSLGKSEKQAESTPFFSFSHCIPRVKEPLVVPDILTNGDPTKMNPTVPGCTTGPRFSAELPLP